MADAGTLDVAARCVDDIERVGLVSWTQEQRDLVIKLARAGIDAARRTRKRDVLVAECVVILRAAGLDKRIVENTAERVIDALGVAVLVEEHERPKTAVESTGDSFEMTVEEFEAQHGQRTA